MATTESKTKRCVIYTRKSTENGLELYYNSLHAQYDHCLRLIRSKSDLGWFYTGKTYEDAGYSGGSLDRPSMQQLLTDVQDGKIDVVVSYRYDRLTRSFMDFAKILEIFERHHVAFVSASESIDTSTPTGRFLPGILILIAQIERENVAVRIRDKMLSAKRRGFWTGGNAPAGYEIVDKRLQPDPVAGPVIHRIFRRYLELASGQAVAYELNKEKVVRSNGRPWRTQNILAILANPVYAGKLYIRQTGELVKGVHKPLVSNDLWEKVKELRKSRQLEKFSTPVKKRLVPLRGFVKCGSCGRKMQSYYTVKKEQKCYVYFRCRTGEELAQDKCPVRAIPAVPLEIAVTEEIVKYMSRDWFLDGLAGKDVRRRELYRAAFMKSVEFWKYIRDTELARFAELLVKEIVVYEDGVKIVFRRRFSKTPDGQEETVFRRIIFQSAHIYMVSTSERNGETVRGPTPLEVRVGKARKWVEMVATGEYESFEHIARSLRTYCAYVDTQARLAFLSPFILEKIASGELSVPSTTKLISDNWSPIWEVQHKVVGLDL